MFETIGTLLKETKMVDIGVLPPADLLTKIIPLLDSILKFGNNSDLIVGALKLVLETFLSIVTQYDPVSIVSKVIKIIFAALTYINFSTSAGWPQHSNINDGENFDFIVVGGGTAGCVLANRLTEISDWKVLLIEAGGDPPILSVVPGLWPFFSHTPWDWDYYSEEDNYSSQALNFRKVAHTRGKMLGGCSSLDHLVYERGSKADFELMGNITGDEGWSWDSVLKYFQKSENMLDERLLLGPTAKFHCDKGPLSVKNHSVNELFLEKNKIMLNIFDEILGTEILADPYTGNIVGNYEWHYKIDKKSRRASTAEEYLKPIKNRSNFFLMKNTLASRVILDNKKKAIGVRVRTPEGEMNIYADREVILSAGVFNTPQLLMLSGIGPRQHLKNYNINIISDLPVGQELKDQIKVPLVISGKNNIVTALDSFISLTELTSMPLPLVGGAFPFGEKHQIAQHLTGFFGALSPLLVYVVLVTLNWNVPVALSYLLTEPTREKIQVLVYVSHLQSTGSVTLGSTDITVPPIIKTGFFSNTEDLRTLSAAIQRTYQVKDSEYVSDARGSFIRPPLADCDALEFPSEEYWQCYGRVLANTAYFPCGTCAIGKVVSSTLKVKGVSCLRVVDASVIPFMPATKIGALTIMIAERAADIIKNDNGEQQSQNFPCN